MEHLINDLKEKIISRMNDEMEKIQRIDAGTNKEAVLISAGKVIEMEYIISLIDNMLIYNDQTKQS
ncbi:MAG: hypothetical protein PHY99_04700 [Bacteroidales bacterium]|nr:hypothetical protein [Bacteroidales bacterium]